MNFTVSANQSWQDTGFKVPPFTEVFINFLEGSYSVGPQSGSFDAGGQPSSTATWSSPLPGAPVGVLVGRLGDGAPFLVGKGSSILHRGDKDLELYLVINDDLYSRHSKGLTDNSGSVKVDIVQGMIVTVDSTKSWQPTGFWVSPNIEVSIDYLDGDWVADPSTGRFGPDGNSKSLVHDNNYPLPKGPIGALVGRLGERGESFLVGRQFKSEYPGQALLQLYLVINDDLYARDGKGLTDNNGSIRVNVSRKLPE